MRVIEALVLAVLGFLLGFAVGRGQQALSAAAIGAVGEAHAAASPVMLVTALLHPPVGVAGAESFVATPRHERLARRADAGDAAATVELLALLETCTLRDETRDFMRNHLDVDADAAPACDSADSCRGVERVYDEFQDAMAQWRDAEADCREVPESWLRTRGRWLEQLAAAGDTEARICYALTGAELAPPPFHPDWPRWMDAWRKNGVLWTWDAWQRGDPRAALALARIYGPNVLFGGPSDLAETDVRIAYRYALVLTRALDLDPATNDVTALVPDLASVFTLEERAEAEAWANREATRIAAHPVTASRMPDACWQHFALFEPKRASEGLAVAP